MEGKGIPREGQSVLGPNGQIGTLTSGTYSTSLKNGIAMGYISTDFINSKQTEVAIDIRGKQVSAKIVKPPFVETKYYRGL